MKEDAQENASDDKTEEQILYEFYDAPMRGHGGKNKTHKEIRSR
jgi:hypothetical protein